MMGDEPFDTGMMIWLDPPKHTTLRHLVSRAFTKRRISQIEDYPRGRANTRGAGFQPAAGFSPPLLGLDGARESGLKSAAG